MYTSVYLQNLSTLHLYIQNFHLLWVSLITTGLSPLNVYGWQRAYPLLTQILFAITYSNDVSNCKLLRSNSNINYFGFVIKFKISGYIDRHI